MIKLDIHSEICEALRTGNLSADFAPITHGKKQKTSVDLVGYTHGENTTKHYNEVGRSRGGQADLFGDFRGLKKERRKIVSETFLEAGAYKVSHHVTKTA